MSSYRHSEETKHKIALGNQLPHVIAAKKLAIKRYWKDVKSGKKPKPKRPGPPGKSVEERFWPKVKKQSDGCWIFVSNKGGGLYGMMSPSKKLKELGEHMAHRISWVLHFGKIPRGLLVLHKCDVPKCVNPGHLFLGTHQINSDDKISKKRHRYGESSPITPFNNKTIKAIRKEYAKGEISQQKLADKYGVHQTAISAIVRRATWKHI